MWSIIGGFVLKFFSGPIAQFLEQREVTKRDTALATIGADKDRVAGQLQAATEANRLRAANQPQFRFLVYLVALPPALHAAGVYLDSLPFWTPFGAHIVGAWGVPAPPGEYQTMQLEILKSFFIIAPVVAGARVLGAAIARR